jgi:hypothetical protein
MTENERLIVSVTPLGFIPLLVPFPGFAVLTLGFIPPPSGLRAGMIRFLSLKDQQAAGIDVS